MLLFVPNLRISVGGAAGILALIVVAGCGSGSQQGTPDPAGSTARVTGEIVVFAAASLTETFTRLGKDFEAANPGATVRFNFAGSSALAQQINQGAPADVFASASPTNMTQVGQAGGLSGEPVTFARNTLQIVVPKDNPGGVTGLADLGKAELKIALCAERVPCGAAAEKAFDAAGVTPMPDTIEQDVKAVLTKVQLGEVDAGLVYRTDVRSAAGDVEGIEFPEADKAVNDYPIAVLARAPNSAAAQAFVDLVLSGHGRSVLSQAGFAGP